MVRIGWPRRPGADRVLLLDRPSPTAAEQTVLLLRIAAEAVILQDEAESILAAVSRHEHLGQVAPRGGALVRRFFALQDQLPALGVDAQLARLRTVLDTVLYHHAVQVATALEFLALEGRSERLHQHTGRYGDLGTPAALLEDAYRELRARPVSVL